MTASSYLNLSTDCKSYQIKFGNKYRKTKCLTVGRETLRCKLGIEMKIVGAVSKFNYQTIRTKIEIHILY